MPQQLTVESKGQTLLQGPNTFWLPGAPLPQQPSAYHSFSQRDDLSLPLGLSTPCSSTIMSWVQLCLPCSMEGGLSLYYTLYAIRCMLMSDFLGAYLGTQVLFHLPSYASYPPKNFFFPVSTTGELKKKKKKKKKTGPKRDRVQCKISTFPVLGRKKKFKASCK